MTEKLIQEIHRLKDSLDGYSAREALDYIESYINIISREQPSLPSNIDEVAKQFQRRWDNDQSPEASFKAGAEWMAGQYEELGTMPIVGKLTTLYRKKLKEKEDD